MSDVPVNAETLTELVKLGIRNGTTHALPGLVYEWAMKAALEVARLRDENAGLTAVHAHARGELDRIVGMTGAVVHATDAECVGCGCRMMSAEECVGELVAERDRLRSALAAERERCAAVAARYAAVGDPAAAIRGLPSP